MRGLQFPSSFQVARSPAEEFALGAELTRMQGGLMDPITVAGILNRAKVRYVIAGAHAVNAYTGKPRATVDVDVITDAPVKATKVLSAAFPDLVAEDHPVVVRLKLEGIEAIDVIKANSNKLFRRVLRLTETIKIDRQPINVPSYEAVLAMKFASMIGPARKMEEKYQDARDFITVASQPRDPDLALLRELGELVYDGGGEELFRNLNNARAGRRLDI
jgi:hypothetical protein